MDLLNKLAPLAPFALEATKYALQKASSPASDLAKEASSNNIKSVESMLSKNPYINRGPALVAAAALGNLSVLDLLLETLESSDSHKRRHHHEPEKIDPNVWSSGTTPLLSAVENKHSKTTKLLLESGAEADLHPKTGTTALQEAAKTGDIEIIELLLSFGANVNHQNVAGDTALIIASRSGHSRTASYLLDHGAEIDMKNRKGSTALSVAARHDSLEVVEVLLKEGADVRVKDRQGRTPLHRAVAGTWLVDGIGGNVKEEIVRKLMRAGADPNAKDDSGKTAADRVGWLTGGEGLKRLLEKRSRTWEAPARDRPARSRTF
jgi:ankyrin repeat protein